MAEKSYLKWQQGRESSLWDSGKQDCCWGVLSNIQALEALLP